ncbi:UDP-N-acetylmuramoylalanine--D-glutamate ligase [Ectothiorhodospira mobilis]|uniref:UDP-N-acetylmuramoylalanine--D-glutamate ligase n=1 Tax=Ectothiorhodospira mobilis TaxID=195064 RepID=A0A1I4RBJ0_ECTMO|nr:UDP-N-acetylmuramoyl-L-alanine--D-glutamate ligase [Ectothiorhodospira mobilis]SFM49406.1 UDP-N-acetylmuramoylalanine--D-glutamate ligase [Ectothiorhodospira mobilis]
MNTLIVGLGETGLSVARHLAARGEAFCVADSRLSPPGVAALGALDPAIPVHLGPFDPGLFTRFSRLLLSPGVSPQEPAVAAARAAGAHILGDIALFADVARAPVVGITGSNGKSTVTTLVAEMARAAGRRVGVGGNLGPPALDLLTDPEPDLYVLELSSFQLETARGLRCAAAAVLNVAADHMDRHAHLDAYAAAKARIYAGAGVAVRNREDPRVRDMPGPAGITFGLGEPAEGDYGLVRCGEEEWLGRGREPLLPVSALRLFGRHNLANALAALALGEAVDLPMAARLQALQRFSGLPHRCQWVARVRGVDWYNDSKGTNLGSTLAALEGLQGPVVLIAGGQGKGQDFTPLREAVRGKARGVILLGQDAARIESALDGVVPVVRVSHMEQAVAEAGRLARRGDCVLLSPACASFDLFRGYAHRGEVFESAVRRGLA